MSDLPPIDLRAEIERIDRDRAETAKFVVENQKLQAESQKLQAESQKLFAEQLKLMSEGRKLDRDRMVAPWLATAAVLGGALGLATFLSRLLEHSGAG